MIFIGKQLISTDLLQEYIIFSDFSQIFHRFSGLSLDMDCKYFTDISQIFYRLFTLLSHPAGYLKQQFSLDSQIFYRFGNQIVTDVLQIFLK